MFRWLRNIVGKTPGRPAVELPPVSHVPRFCPACGRGYRDNVEQCVPPEPMLTHLLTLKERAERHKRQ